MEQKGRGLPRLAERLGDLRGRETLDSGEQNDPAIVVRKRVEIREKPAQPFVVREQASASSNPQAPDPPGCSRTLLEILASQRKKLPGAW